MIGDELKCYVCDRTSDDGDHWGALVSDKEEAPGITMLCPMCLGDIKGQIDQARTKAKEVRHG